MNIDRRYFIRHGVLGVDAAVPPGSGSDFRTAIRDRHRCPFRSRKHAAHLLILLAMVFSVAAFLQDANASGSAPQGGAVEQVAGTAPPFDGALQYPFTKREAETCGHWRRGSQDYPYFGAPRDGNRRRHAGIDLYPVRGEGVPVKAVRDGCVIRVAPFYTRRSGEITYAILVDHGAFVVNYAELKKPALAAGAVVKRNQAIGIVSGTKQLHFELYSPGTENWLSWHNGKPQNLMDPTDMMIRVFGLQGPESRLSIPRQAGSRP
jgi:murein DD-endopeptidase MepM/ murein hydrolase activator NlpD